MKKFRFLTLIFIALCLLTVVSCRDDEEKEEPDDEIPIVIETKTIYASPEGERATTGTREDPYNISYAMEQLRVGYTLILLPGVYKSNMRFTLARSGTAEYPITITTENDDDFVEIDFSEMAFDGGNRGIQINGNHYYVYNIRIKGAGDNGMYIAGSYNVIEYCEFYNNRDSGLQLGRASSDLFDIDDWPSNNLIKNCTSYNNFDDLTKGENADGFAAKLTVGHGNVFDGCIAYRNSDDGWDLYAKTDSGNIGTVVLYNCVAFENGILLDGSTTDDGDGNGFKLGGSVMKGDAILENCLSFNNMAYGVTDNSNPGVLSINNTTAFNNSFTLDRKNQNHDFTRSSGEFSNFDLARTIDGKSKSYNNASGLLSYNNLSNALYDLFKGALSQSILQRPGSNYNEVYEFQDVYTLNNFGSRYFGLNDSCFAEVPGETGKNLVNAHTALRNPDQSINMGNILKITDQSIIDRNIGANLSRGSWDDYDHYQLSDYTTAKTEDELAVLGAYDNIVLNCNPARVFQDFEVYIEINNCDIAWTSRDEKVLKFNYDEITTSYSMTKQIFAVIYRNRDFSQSVWIDATITKGDAKKVRSFELIIAQDTPSIGELFGYEGVYISEVGSPFEMPEIIVNNNSSITLKPLENGADYVISYTYEHAENTTAIRSKVDGIDINTPGVYFVKGKITSLLDYKDVSEFSYLTFIASPDANVDFIGGVCEVNVQKDGFLVYGQLSNVTGYVYAYRSASATISKEEVKEKGVKLEIYGEEFRQSVKSVNDGPYYVHIVITNKNGLITSDVYTRSVQLVEINNEQQFYDLTKNQSDPTTIYKLTRDLDYAEFDWKVVSNANTFTGLFDGNGYTIKNITVDGSDIPNTSVDSPFTGINIFTYVRGGSIINVQFENIQFISTVASNGSLTSSYVGVVGRMHGGSIYNVRLVNISANGYESISALVGFISGGINTIDQVSLTNDENSVLAVSARYLGGLVGNIQNDSGEQIEVYVSDCIVLADVGDHKDTKGHIGGVIGRIKNNSTRYVVEILRCYYKGTIDTNSNHASGLLGGCEQGTGNVKISYSISWAKIIYKLVTYDGTPDDHENYDTILKGHKNGSPIIGRMTVGEGTYTFEWNYANFHDANTDLVQSTVFNFFKVVVTEKLYTDLTYDLTNVWIFDAETGTIALRDLVRP